jgi:hypothetical protein
MGQLLVGVEEAAQALGIGRRFAARISNRSRSPRD